MVATVNDLQPEFRNIHNRRPLGTELERGRVAGGLWDSIATADAPNSRTSPSLVEKLPENDHDTYNRILKSLEFDEMRAREEQIATPFPETFQWLLDGDGGGLGSGSESSLEAKKKPLTKFTGWLESEVHDVADPFWITGKAASGKSTLMKFICSSPQVQTHLRAWSGKSQLLNCSVYFWHPGSSRQKTQAGLLRTILHQLLSQRPDLCRHVALRRYLYFQLAGVDSPDPPTWTLEELQECVTRFISRIDGTSRLAIFIDGLDEYEGNLERLITFLKRLQDNSKVIKLCISSRPWNVFRDAFDAFPSLTMELLTRADIEKYVCTRIGGNRALQELRAIDSTSVQNLEFQIINRAEGVFLWVVLVTEKIIATACNNNDLIEIWKIFETLPVGLEDLYDSMRSRLEPSLREKASRMYQLLFQWNAILDRPFGLLEFRMAINCHDPVTKVLQPFHVPTNDQIPHIQREMERGLAGATGGILQVQAYAEQPKVESLEHDADPVAATPLLTQPQLPTVGFLHRTVFEWLQKIQPAIVSDGPLDYDPALVLTSVLVSWLNFAFTNNRDHDWELERYPIHTEEAFKFTRFCTSSAKSRAKLLIIIQNLKIGNRKSLCSHLIPSSYILLSSISDSKFRSILAIMFLSAPYLEAELESPASYLRWLEMPRIVQMMPSRFWGKRRRIFVMTILDILLDKAGTRQLQILNIILKIFEILVRAQFAPRRVLQAAVKNRGMEGRGLGTLPNELRQALLDGLAGKGFNEITSITRKSLEEEEEFVPPRLKSRTAMRVRRKRHHYHRGFKEYMHDQKAKLRE